MRPETNLNLSTGFHCSYMELAEQIRKLRERGITVDSDLRQRIEELTGAGQIKKVIVSGLKAPLGVSPQGRFVSLSKTKCAFSRCVGLRLREATHRKVQALRGNTPRGTWLRHLIEEAIEHKCTA